MFIADHTRQPLTQMEGKKQNKFPTPPPSTPCRKLGVYWMPITMVTVLSLLDTETHSLEGCYSTNKERVDGYQLCVGLFLTCTTHSYTASSTNVNNS